MGTPGASARREHRRRAERERARTIERIEADLHWRETVTARSPVIGRVRTALRAKPQMTPESQATTTRAIGTDGEERVAEVLSGTSVIALHDRRVPKSRANIDHIAVGPAGVFVIDAKKYTGNVETRETGGLQRSEVRLYVKGRDRTKLIEGVKGQCDVVRTALDDDLAGIPVAGVLCFVGAEWPGLIGNKRVQVGGVTCIWPAGLADVVEVPGPLTRSDILSAAAALAEVLRPA